MTKVLFRVNLGSSDAAKLDIANFRECLTGNAVALEDSAATALDKAGIATIVEVIQPPKPKASAKPVDLKADPVVDVESTATSEVVSGTDSKDGKKK